MKRRIKIITENFTKIHISSKNNKLKVVHAILYLTEIQFYGSPLTFKTILIKSTS